MIANNYYRRLKLVGLAVLITITILSPPAAAQDPLPPFDPHFGIVDSFVNTEEANAAGAGWTRVFFRWDVVQPAGPFDWKPTNVPDTFLNAELAAGREVVAVLIGTPAWASDSGVSTAVPQLEFWGDFVFKIATQYKGRIKHWVIWNQPDISDAAAATHTWDGSEADYYLLLKEAYSKIKAVDPEMQVHLAGLTYVWDRDRGNPQYLSRLLDIIAADPQAANQHHYFDVVSYHIYYDPRLMLEILTDVRSMLDAHGMGNKPIWINETNAPPSEDFLEPPEGPTAFNITLEQQSAYVIQAFALGLAGGAERIAFNKLRNERLHPESVEPYGLLRGDNSRRPAFNAFQVVTTFFAGVKNATWLQLGNVYIVTLDRDGQTTTVLWNMARTPINFTLNAIAPEGLLVDDQGNQRTAVANSGVRTIQLPGADCSNGENCFIGGVPRLVIEVGSPDQRAALLPLLTPTPTVPPPTDTPVPTATPLPPPTLTPPPAPVVNAVEVSGGSPAGGEPTAVPDSQPSLPAALPDPGVGENGLPGSLPDPGVGQADTPGTVPAPGLGQADEKLSPSTPAEPELTPVPPVSFSTVMRPRRVLWLFIIGLIIFTVSYGVQVVIWYRLKR